MPSQRIHRKSDLSGALQSATSHILRKRNEVAKSFNATYNHKIGSATRRLGYEKVGRTILEGKDALGGGVYEYEFNNKIIAGHNNEDDSNAVLRYLGGGDYWYPLLTAAPNTRFQHITFLDELYVAGRSPNNVYMTLTNVNGALDVSTQRNVLNAPKARFIAEYGGSLYALNVEVDGVKYPDRAYKSSPPLGAITFIQTDQSGLLKQLRVDSVRYLKPGMTIDIYGAGTEAKKVDSLEIVSVDKKNNRITFQATQINVSDNDEIWLEDRKNKLSILWNTDYPTKETADWLRIPTETGGSNPEITGWGKSNNRFLIYTRSSTHKWDGANLIAVSETIGCTSHESIKNVDSWVVWLHDTGIWAYNDGSGELLLLSRGIEDTIKAIQQHSLLKASAGVVGRVYKLSVGELLNLETGTTSTSTSSTSTSTTSTSTSSTSTSSTSTSSTSTSTSITTTSTSTSSTSTSSTSSSISTSSTSTSMSTSSTSTSTSTLETPREVIRIIYDFDLNRPWLEKHRREIRFQFNHTMHGYNKPYFLDDTGRLFRDETGDLDYEDTIPMEIELGRDHLDTEQKKQFVGIYIESEQARTAKISYSIDDGNFKPLGQLDAKVKRLQFGDRPEGTDINYKLTHNDAGERPIINGPTTFYTVTEQTHGTN